MACGRVAARLVDLLHDHRGLGEIEPEAAVLGRDQRGEQAGGGEGVDELLRVAPVAIGLAPVLVRKRGAQCPGAGTEFLQVGVGHDRVPSSFSCWRAALIQPVTMPATRLSVVARMTVPNRYDRRQCRSTTDRIMGSETLVSET